MVLAKNLPDGSQTWVALGVDAAWTVGEHLAAANADLLAGANWQRGGGKGKQPDRIPRPGDVLRNRLKAERALAKAAKFKAVHAAPAPPAATPPSTTDRPRDERGRFVSRKGA